MTERMTERMSTPGKDRPGILRESMRWLRPFWKLAVFATVAGTLSGFATAWLLATINQALHAPGGATAALLWTFAGLCLLTIGSAIASDIANGILGQHVLADVREELCTKIMLAPLSAIERFRAHRLIATLNHDIDSVTAFAFSFAQLVVAFAVVVGCLAYMVFLSPALAGIAALAVLVGILVHFFARRHGIRLLGAARVAQDDLFAHFRAISEGAKELRINRPRRRRLFGSQSAIIDRIRRMHIRAIRIYSAANVFGSLLFFIVIGVILAIDAGAPADRAVVSGFVIVLLYAKGPLEQLVLALPMIGQAQVAMRRIADLSTRFATREAHVALTDAPADGAGAATGMARIDLKGVRYHYPSADGAAGFALGPIDLTIRQGEILFVTGANGCGKTTLIKLLTGLYEPHEGRLLLDGEEVIPERRDDYRQLFSAIFFDFHLFDDLVLEDPNMAARVDGYLQRLEIAHKVSIDAEGRFSTTDLSAGQRKRLALVQVYLEGREVLVFDEWAAEQDPTFRRIFYTEILPDLKRQGKTLVVISHDDRFFDIADRRILLEEGKVVPVETTTEGQDIDGN